MPLRLDPLEVRDDGTGWIVLFETPEKRVSTRWSEEHNAEIRKTEIFYDEELFAQNKAQFDDSEGKRWGDGKIVGRVPLHKLFQSEIGDKIKEGDTDHLKWWLDSEDAKKYRTFKGRIS